MIIIVVDSSVTGSRRPICPLTPIRAQFTPTAIIPISSKASFNIFDRQLINKRSYKMYDKECK